jgi:hypothetical protein
MSEIRQQRQIFHDQVKQMRVKINSHLDTPGTEYSERPRLCRSQN